MDREQIKQLIEVLLEAGSNLAKLTPTEVDDRIAAVAHAIFGTLWPLFTTNGEAAMLTDEEAALVSEVTHKLRQAGVQ